MHTRLRFSADVADVADESERYHKDQIYACQAVCFDPDCAVDCYDNLACFDAPPCEPLN